VSNRSLHDDAKWSQTCQFVVGIDVSAEAVLCRECTCHSGWCQAEERGREDISKVDLAFVEEINHLKYSQSDTL
jgi:hypothetical protein